MKMLIDSYRGQPGEHCGSTAMRGLLQHYCGLALPEPAVFGLGAGLDCVYLASPDLDPSAVVFGRTLSMESDVGLALGIDYREQIEPDDAKAWELVRNEVLAGRPTMLSGDIFYLDYREYKVHFPGHRFVLVGFDDEREVAYIADRIRAEPEVCSYPALFLSRNPPEGLSTQNQWGRFHSTEPTRSLAEAAHFAIERCSRRMLNRDPAAAAEPSPIPAMDLTSGIAGIRRLAAELPHWGRREDARWLASYNARCIEKFGNGGGNFRRLYADFLEWAQGLGAGLVPENAGSLARRAADAWTGLSGVLELASGEGASAEVWSRAADEASRIAELESELFASLAASAG